MRVSNKQVVQKLRQLGEMGEIVIDGQIWTKMGEEFKVSPRGLSGDFDTNCHWIHQEELDYGFGAPIVYEVTDRA